MNGPPQKLHQSLTSLTLADSSIATLRGELSSVRTALSRQTGTQARSTGWEEKVKAAEKEKDEVKEELAAERRARSDADRKRRAQDERLGELDSDILASHMVWS